MERVTIIITTFNRINLLKECIAGALEQNYPYLEILISDNASNDGTEQLVRKIQESDNRVKYFKNETNLGSQGNHEIALFKYCTSDWAVFVSDDDALSDPDFVSRGMELIKQNGGNEVGFYQAGVITRFESSGTETIFTPNIDKDREYNPQEYFEEYFKINFFSFTTTLFNRKYLVENVIPRGFMGSDVQLMLALSLEKKVILTSKVSGIYKVHSGQNFGRSSFRNYLNLYKDTYPEVCNYAYNYTNLSKATILMWLNRSIEYYRLNVEGWIKNKIEADPDSIFPISNKFAIRLYPRIKQHLGMSFIIFPIYDNGKINRLNIYLPGLYYQLYWSFFSTIQKIKFKFFNNKK